MGNNKINELIQEYSTEVKETFLEMDNKFSNVTNYEVLNNCSVEELLNNQSASYKINENNWLNVEFDIEHMGSGNLLDTIILIKKVELI